jgi:hypothetical protein
MFCLMTLLVCPTCRPQRHSGTFLLRAVTEIPPQLTSTSHLKELSRRNLLNPKMLSTKISSTRKASKRAHDESETANNMLCSTADLWSSISRRTHSSMLAGSPSAPARDRRCAIRTMDSRNSAKSILPLPLSKVAPLPEPPAGNYVGSCGVEGRKRAVPLVPQLQRLNKMSRDAV